MPFVRPSSSPPSPSSPSRRRLFMPMPRPLRTGSSAAGPVPGKVVVSDVTNGS